MDQPCGIVESAPTRLASPYNGYLGPGQKCWITTMKEHGRRVLQDPEGVGPGNRSRREQGSTEAFAREPVRLQKHVRNGSPRCCKSVCLRTLSELAPHHAAPQDRPDTRGESQPNPVGLLDHLGRVRARNGTRIRKRTGAVVGNYPAQRAPGSIRGS